MKALHGLDNEEAKILEKQLEKAKEMQILAEVFLLEASFVYCIDMVQKDMKPDLHAKLVASTQSQYNRSKAVIGDNEHLVQPALLQRAKEIMA